MGYRVRFEFVLIPPRMEHDGPSRRIDDASRALPDPRVVRDKIECGRCEGSVKPEPQDANVCASLNDSRDESLRVAG